MDWIRQLFRGRGEHLQDRDTHPGTWPAPDAPLGDRTGSLGDGIPDGLDDLGIGGPRPEDGPHSLDMDPAVDDELTGGAATKPL